MTSTTLYGPIALAALIAISSGCATKNPPAPAAPPPIASASAPAPDAAAAVNAQAAATNAQTAATNAQSAAALAQSATAASQSAQSTAQAAAESSRTAIAASQDAATRAAQARQATADLAATLQTSQQEMNETITRLQRQWASRAVRPATNPLAPIDDYVPCELNNDQMLQLKFQEPAPSDLQSAADSLVAAGIVAPENENAFLSMLPANPSSARIRDAITSHSKLVKAAPGGNVQDAIDKAVTTVAAVAATFTAPTDIACSMVMMSWQMAADSFGRHVADQYIAFEIVMRNLNTTQEFLMHNVSIAVDDQRFYSGIDKMVVRNSQDHGLYYDRRNFSITALEIAGDLAAGTAPFGSAGIQGGIAVFRSALIPGASKLFHDRSTNQIQALSDLAFSSSTSYKIVVPVKGSSPFVTFLPADIFSRKIGQTSSTTAKKSWHYKYWAPDDLHRFLEHTYVIAAGVHVTEVHNDQPTLASLDCKGAAGTLDLNHADANGTTLTCAVQGTNLDKVSALRLKDAADTTDTIQADGVISIPGGQNSAGSAVFQMKDLAALTGSSYAVYAVVNKTEQITPVRIKLTPVITDIEPATYAIPNAACTGNCSFTLTGHNLKALASVSFTGSAGKATATTFDPSSATVTIPKATIEALSPGTFTVTGKTSDARDALSTATLTITK